MMTVGDCLSPITEIQMEVLNEIQNYLKNIDGKNRAVLIYYLVLKLHLFYDGNGRTARFLYDVFSDINMYEDYTKYIHSDKGSRLYTSNFEIENSFMRIEDVTELVNEKLFSELIEIKEINDTYGISSFKIRMNAFFVKPDGENVFIPSNVKKDLTKLEISEIGYAFLDSETSYSISAMAFAILASRKGILSECLHVNNLNLNNVKIEMPFLYRKQKEYITFFISKSFKPELSQIIMERFSKDDYLEMVKISEDLKRRQLRKLINLFLDPREKDSLDKIMKVNNRTKIKV